mmetsp:Transcript_116859/g.232905  ORF Transcript_116859/g.232905 Transcript_116859/m.232905 type:complete len:221 (-) Transcript_116859:46-708(-)
MWSIQWQRCTFTSRRPRMLASAARSSTSCWSRLTMTHMQLLPQARRVLLNQTTTLRLLTTLRYLNLPRKELLFDLFGDLSYKEIVTNRQLAMLLQLSWHQHHRRYTSVSQKFMPKLPQLRRSMGMMSMSCPCCRVVGILASDLQLAGDVFALLLSCGGSVLHPCWSRTSIPFAGLQTEEYRTMSSGFLHLFRGKSAHGCTRLLINLASTMRARVRDCSGR